MPGAGTIIAVFLVSTGSSFLCATSGGAGLILVPVLILLGLAPREAIATDLFALLGGAASGFRQYLKSGKVDLRLAAIFAVLAGAGAILGGLVSLKLDAVLLKRLIGAGMVLMLIPVLAKKQIGLQATQPRAALLPLGYAGIAVAGAWGALFGGGFLIICTYVAVLIFGKSFLEAAGTLKPVSFAIALTVLTLFAAADSVWWSLGLTAMAGKALGTHLGVKYFVEKGDSWARVAFAVIVVGSSAKLWLS